MTIFLPGIFIVQFLILKEYHLLVQKHIYFLTSLSSRQEVYLIQIFENKFNRIRIYLFPTRYLFLFYYQQTRGGVKRGHGQRPFNGVHACTRISNKAVHKWPKTMYTLTKTNVRIYTHTCNSNLLKLYANIIDTFNQVYCHFLLWKKFSKKIRMYITNWTFIVCFGTIIVFAVISTHMTNSFITYTSPPLQSYFILREHYTTKSCK